MSVATKNCQINYKLIGGDYIPTYKHMYIVLPIQAALQAKRRLDWGGNCCTKLSYMNRLFVLINPGENAGLRLIGRLNKAQNVHLYYLRFSKVIGINTVWCVNETKTEINIILYRSLLVFLLFRFISLMSDSITNRSI